MLKCECGGTQNIGYMTDMPYNDDEEEHEDCFSVVLLPPYLLFCYSSEWRYPSPEELQQIQNTISIFYGNVRSKKKVHVREGDNE